MRAILITFISSSIAVFTSAQAAFVLPSPTAADEEMTLYIDVNQTTSCANNGNLKGFLQAHPEFQDSIYLWTWEPAEQGRPIPNGNWDDSNEGMRMTHVSGMLYSYTFIPTTFYNVDGPTFFSRGLKCLAKFKSGNPYPGVDCEPKTDDLVIPIIPKLCDDLYCPFPQLGKTEDFITITYDNNQETQPELQNMGPDDCYLFLRADYDPDNFSGISYVPAAQVTSTPALKMTYIGDGFFRLTILPDDFFTIPDINIIDHLRFYALRPGFLYTGPPPYDSYTFLTCE